MSFLFIKVVVVSHDTRQNDAALISSLNVVLALLGGYLFTDEPSPEEQGPYLARPTGMTPLLSPQRENTNQ
ncbi:hypothetical protein WKW23_22575 [Vibrio alginolyticus]|uniref:hypothetical protein n=1 Tax=Vibrio alginolyticus TaxID=663 RepID=UPI00102DD7D9|nr:hypothetical protein [Vibrio alginolyticus]RZV16216.1 hypothetical protein EOJ41_18890 [Vibrio alginolyticus]